jgi:16S rRNA (cytidine1402-2'-O)-methyltransferase
VTKGTLYLVPSGLGSDDVAAHLPQDTREILAGLDCFIAENPKTARAFLKAAGYPRPLQELAIETLDEHTRQSRIADLLAPLERGADCGLLSEAGCPAVADPGAALVRQAHAAGIRVAPLIGPSALLLALMASGMNGQRFAFHGYLPVERTARAKRLIELESASDQQDATQLFIEAPYRNDAMLDAVLKTCRSDTLLCLATDLTLDTQAVCTRSISDWKNARPALNRRPTVFLLYRERPSDAKR